MFEKNSVVTFLLFIFICFGFFFSWKFHFLEMYNFMGLWVVACIFPYALLTFKMDSSSFLHIGLKRIALVSTQSIALAIGWVFEVVLTCYLFYKLIKLVIVS